MKQLKQSQFVKNGIEHENISSPETSTISTRVISISVDKYGKFQYTTDGVNYIELDPQTSEITSVDTIYNDVSELPENQQYGTILPAYTNTALPVILYEYTEDDGWVEKQQVNEYSIYYVTDKGTLYIFIGTDFVSTTPEQAIKIISPSSNVLTTEEYNTLVANNCVLGTSISGLDWAEAGTILTKPFEYNGSLRGMYIRNSKIGTYLITISTKTIGNGATDIVFNQVAQFNGKAMPSYPSNTGTFNLQIIDGTITWNADNYVTTNTAQTITGAKTIKNRLEFEQSSSGGGASKLAIYNDNGYNAKIKMGNTENMRIMTGGTYFGANASPIADNTTDLGASSTKWKDLYLSGNLTDGTNSIAISDIASKTNIASNYVSVNAQELTSTQQTQARTNIDAQETIDANNMLSADLVDDTNTTHKFATSSELSQIATNTSDIATINGKIPSEASSSNKLADKEFVNSSINNFAAYYITKNVAGDPFDTKAQLFSASTFYSGGATRTPTINDYAIVTADETKGVIASGYTSFTSTADYVDYYVIYNNESVLVTDANKDSLGITAGTTIAYESLPTTRYSYQGGTYPNGQWEYQYSLNNTAFTQAQMNALNSGIDSTKVGQIATNQTDIGLLTTNVGSLSSNKMDKADPTGTGSLAVGNNVTASGTNSVAVGNNTSADGNYSHAEGLYAEAIATASHAEGEYTTASGRCSHAEGEYTTASGDYSHSQGRGTIAQRRSQNVFGEYNILDTKNDKYNRGAYVEIVGNGGENTRSNARTLDWSGNEELAGNIIAKGGKIGDGKNNSYKLAIPDTTSWTADKTIATTDQIPSQTITITTTSGSESISDGTNTLNFGANAFTNTAIPTSYVSSVNGSTGAITNVAKTDTTQSFTAEQTFTGNIKNTGTYYIGSGNVVLASMSGSDLTLGNSSSVLKFAGSGTNPTYNGNSLALDNDVVHTTGDEMITGTKSIGDNANNVGVIKLGYGSPLDNYHYNRIEDNMGLNIVCSQSSSLGGTIYLGNTTDVMYIKGSGNRPLYNSNSTELALMSDLYPVGAVYISTNSTSPASLFGGTWSEISAGNALWTTATSSGDAGGTISAGLPNIKGGLTNIGSNANDAGASGAFTKSAGTNSYGNTNSGNKKTNISFDAHNWNTIYSDSVTTVQPPAYKVYAWVRTA